MHNCKSALLLSLIFSVPLQAEQNFAQSSARLNNANSALRDWQEAMHNTDIAHQKYRDDRYVAALSILAKHVKHLLYLARAVTPGNYVVVSVQAQSMYHPEWQVISASIETMLINSH
ncbi:hypothetical protein FXF61_04400 [Pseudomonas sp. C27(2019)]|nr:hypothetical protein FXF61_04400 [Pseudomonas sp. C27(2019)]